MKNLQNIEDFDVRLLESKQSQTVTGGNVFEDIFDPYIDMIQEMLDDLLS